MRKLRLILPFLLLSIFLAACNTGYREIDTLSVISALGIDKSGEQNLDITTEISVMNGSDSTIDTTYKTYRGNGYYDALFTENSTRELFLSHAETIFLSEKIGDDLKLLIDDLMRGGEVRLSAFLVLCKDESAKDMLTYKEQGVMTGIDAKNKITHAVSQAKTVDTKLYNFVNSSLEGVALIPAFHKISDGENELYEVYGSAIFNDFQLVDYLDTEQNLWYHVLKNTCQNGSFKDEGGNIYEIKSSMTNHKITENDEGFTIEFHIMLDLKLTHSENQDFVLLPEKTTTLETLVRASSEKNISELLDLSKELETDFLNLADLINSDKDKTQNFTLENLKTEVTVSTSISDSGQIFSSGGER